MDRLKGQEKYDILELILSRVPKEEDLKNSLVSKQFHKVLETRIWPKMVQITDKPLLGKISAKSILFLRPKLIKQIDSISWLPDSDKELIKRFFAGTHPNPLYVESVAAHALLSNPSLRVRYRLKLDLIRDTKGKIREMTIVGKGDRFNLEFATRTYKTARTLGKTFHLLHMKDRDRGIESGAGGDDGMGIGTTLRGLLTNAHKIEAKDFGKPWPALANDSWNKRQVISAMATVTAVGLAAYKAVRYLV